jgi:hypothetical protein
MKWGVALILALTLLTQPSGAMANDTAATLGAGGLQFVRNDTIRMASEDLFLSREEVRVTYRFENTSDEDQELLIAFPMPDIRADYYAMVAYPTTDGENIFGFSTLFDGEPVTAELHQYAFALGVDRTEALGELGIPLAPHLQGTIEAIATLPAAERERLAALGVLAVEYEYTDETEVPFHVPAWTLKSSYVWEAVFPAGETVEVEHAYTPSVGGTVGVTFLYDGEMSTEDEYRRKYCMDNAFINAARASMSDPDEPWSSPYYESWLSYVLSTGNNWAGPIGEFRLVVDTGSSDTLVAFCGDGVEQTGPTRYEVVAEDFYAWEDIDVLFLVPFNEE